MRTQYLLVDDESAARIGPLCDALARPELELTVDHQKPLAFEEEIEQLKLKEEGFGVILDNRLDDQTSGNGNRRRYRGFSLAQEIRTRATDTDEWRRWSYPVVLLSMQAKLDRFYEPDLTSHDLFDAVYSKEEVEGVHPERISRELHALARGYAHLRNIRGIRDPEDLTRKLLGSGIDQARIDPRIAGALINPDRPCHFYAQFILRELLERPGPLIDESYLAARLGIDRLRSKDWNALKKWFSTCRYTGVFHEAWERWWAQDVEHWWNSLKIGRSSWTMLLAADRARILRSATGLADLEVAEPIRPHYSQRYWTTCSELDMPLDPLDGVRIAEPEPQPWQEPRYICIDVAIEGNSKRNLRIHRLEQERVDTLRESGGENG